MATIEDENNLRSNINDLLNSILARTPESLIRKESLGTELSFENGLPYFSRVFSLVYALKNCDLSRVPHPLLAQIHSSLSEIDILIKEVENFSVASTSNPAGTRDNFIIQFNEKYAGWFNIMSPIIAFSVREGTDFQALQKQANDFVNNIEKIQKQAMEASEKQKKELDLILETVRRAAAEVGVSQHSTHFKDEASEYKIEARTWLKRATGFAIGTGVWGLGAFYFMQISPERLNDLSFIQIMIARFSVLLILFISTIWCSKNYASACHNYVINKHRQNALSTFETFVKAVDDNDMQTKNAVLLQATQCIFSPQTTGFSDKGTDTESPTKIIEFVKDVSKIGK